MVFSYTVAEPYVPSASAAAWHSATVVIAVPEGQPLPLVTVV